MWALRNGHTGVGCILYTTGSRRVRSVFRRFALPLCVPMAAVQTGRKHGHNTDEVLGEFNVGLGFGIRWLRHLDHLATVTLKNELDKIVREPTQSVAVGDVHTAQASRNRMSQQRPEGRSAEVDATGDVTEDAGVGVVGLQHFDLTLEVVRLLAGGHAGVDGLEAAICGCRWWWFVGGGCVAPLNGLEIKESMLSDA